MACTFRTGRLTVRMCIYIYIDIYTYVFFVKNTRTSYLPHLSFLFTAPSLQLSPWLSPLCATSPAVSSVLLAPLQASTMHGCKQFGLTFGLVKKLRVSHLVFFGLENHLLKDPKIKNKKKTQRVLSQII